MLASWAGRRQVWAVSNGVLSRLPIKPGACDQMFDVIFTIPTNLLRRLSDQEGGVSFTHVTRIDRRVIGAEREYPRRRMRALGSPMPV